MKTLLLLLFLNLLFFFTFTFPSVFAQNKSTNIKPPKDFAKKLVFYEQLLHQEWDFWDLKENKNNVEKIKIKTRKEQEKEQIKSQTDAIFTHKFFSPLVRFVYKQHAELTKKIAFFEKQRQDSLTKINGTYDQALEKKLHETHTFIEGSKLFEKRKIAFENRKKILEENKDQKIIYRRDTNAFVFKHDTLLEPYYIFHIFKHDSNGTKIHESVEYFLEDKDADRIFNEKESFEEVVLGRKIKRSRKGNTISSWTEGRYGYGKSMFYTDSPEIKIEAYEYRQKIESKLNHESLFFKKDSIAFDSQRYYTKCRFVLIQGNKRKQDKKYLDLHYGDSPLHFHRIEILEITKEKLVFGICDNPDFTKFNHCIYHSKNYPNRQKIKGLEKRYQNIKNW